MNWNDKSVLITGAASGIGRNLAQELAGAGAGLSLIDVDRDGLEELHRGLSLPAGDTLIETVDVTDESAVESVVKRTDEELDGLDVVVANAGLGYPTPATEFSLERSKRLLDVNVNGVVNTVVPAIDRMVENGQGHVVIVSSVAAFVNFKGGASYCASKSGVLRLAEGLRLDLRETDVDVTTIHPGWVKTKMTEVLDEDLRMFEISAERAAENIRRAIENNKRKAIFPWQARLLVGLLKFVPDPLVDFVLSKLPGAETFYQKPLKDPS